jgi:hypothetical protein
MARIAYCTWYDVGNYESCDFSIFESASISTSEYITFDIAVFLFFGIGDTVYLCDKVNDAFPPFVHFCMQFNLVLAPSHAPVSPGLYCFLVLVLLLYCILPVLTVRVWNLRDIGNEAIRCHLPHISLLDTRASTHYSGT